MSKNLGRLTKDLFNAKKLKSEHNAEIKLLNVDIKAIETLLLEEMQSQDLLKLSDEFGTVYISRQTVPKVINWDAFYEHIRKHNAFEMLERRPSKKAFQESYEQGIPIPGIDPVVFDEVRTRKT
jgi:hypothetical protein